MATKSEFIGKFLDMDAEGCSGNQNFALLEKEFRSLVRANPEISDSQILDTMKTNWSHYMAASGPYSMFNLPYSDPQHVSFLNLNRPEAHALLYSFREGKTKKERLELLKGYIDASQDFRDSYVAEQSSRLLVSKSVNGSSGNTRKPVSEMNSIELRLHRKEQSEQRGRIFGVLFILAIVGSIIRCTADIEPTDPQQKEIDSWMEDNMRQEGDRYYYDPKDKKSS